jgi:uncharacterized protein YxjI
MKYVIKQKLVTMKPAYEIFDHTGASVYKVKGSFGGRESFKIVNSEGQTLATCATKFNPLSIVGAFLRFNFKRYHVTDGEKDILSLGRTFNPFTIAANAHSSTIENLVVTNSIMGSYQFRAEDKVLCDINKKNLVVGTDEYHVEIADDQSQLGFLMSVIALDRVFFTRR